MRLFLKANENNVNHLIHQIEYYLNNKNKISNVDKNVLKRMNGALHMLNEEKWDTQNQVINIQER